MGFPRNVKEQILVDTARHCCVCHRYKGVKVEVHHIEQEALGGKNTYENAIAVCFDCHADAGHYNPKHPRGTKFSPSELKKAKENWIKLVQKNSIKEPQNPDVFLCQYFVCENYENLVEIVNGNLTKFPLENPLILKNEILKSLGEIIANHPESYRHANAWGDGYKEKEDYLKKHPDTCITDSGDSNFPYFELFRTPSREELEKHSSADGVLKLMLKHDMPIENISSIVGCYEHACWGVELQEEYIFRKLWCSFIAITNISDKYISLDSVEGNIVIENKFMPFLTSSNNYKSFVLPKMPIRPGSTVLVPIAVILPPLYPLTREELSSSSSGGWSEQHQVVTHASITSKNISDCYTYGGQINPTKIHYKMNGNILSQNVHQFDLTNLYCIDRSWACGSCPHLFLVQNDEISYSRELLAHCESNTGEDIIIVPPEVQFIIIAEIEDERTEIDAIYIDGTLYDKHVVLNKSDFIKIPVNEGATIRVVGKYIPTVTVNHKLPQGIKRNEIVSHFMYSFSTHLNKMELGT